MRGVLGHKRKLRLRSNALRWLNDSSSAVTGRHGRQPQRSAAQRSAAQQSRAEQSGAQDSTCRAVVELASLSRFRTAAQSIGF